MIGRWICESLVSFCERLMRSVGKNHCVLRFLSGRIARKQCGVNKEYFE